MTKADLCAYVYTVECGLAIWFCTACLFLKHVLSCTCDNYNADMAVLSQCHLVQMSSIIGVD